MYQVQYSRRRVVRLVYTGIYYQKLADRLSPDYRDSARPHYSYIHANFKYVVSYSVRTRYEITAWHCSQEILDQPCCPDIPLNVLHNRHPEKSNAAPSNKPTASTIASKDYQ